MLLCRLPLRLAGQEVRPQLHQCAAPLEEVGSGVGLFGRIMADSGEPIFSGDGNTRLLSSRKTDASRRRSRACLLRGTRCSMPAFIRWDGIRHSWPWRSISSQVAPRASPERAAVSTRNRKHNLAATEAWDDSTASSAAPTS